MDQRLRLYISLTSHPHHALALKEHLDQVLAADQVPVGARMYQ
jgi:hypothetical protein